MPNRLRKLFGAVALIVFVGLYAVFAAALASSNPVASAAWPIQLAVYAIAGTLWVVPAGAIIGWMVRR